MKKNLSLISLIILSLLLLSACGQKTEKEGQVSSGSEEATKAEEELIINLEGDDWGNLTPYNHYFRGPGAYKMRLIFDSMLERGEEGLIPWLAESWEIDDSGRNYSFKIREGVLWQDGQAMTAQDIKFSFQYYREHPPVRDDLSLGDNDYIEEIELIDDHTINIRVQSPDASLLERFGTARILPKHIWEHVDDPTKFNDPQALIGCGPYELVDYKQEEGAYRFQAFQDYWGPKPAASQIRFVPVSDNILAFENGEIDLVGISPDLLAKYEEDESYKIIENPAFWGYKLLFNMEENEAFKDKDLRQALAYAIDRDELVEKVARGAGKVASAGYLPKEHVDYNDKVKKYEFDLEKAKDLLDGETYQLSMLIGNSNPEVRIGELIKLNLEKVGIDLDITSLDTKSRDAAIKKGEYEIVLTGNGGWGNDPDILREEFHSKLGNIPGYVNTEIDSLSQDQLLEMDPAKRKELIFQLQELIAQELPLIPLYHNSGYTLYRPSKYDGWKHVFDHHEMTHNKISFLEMD